MVHISRMLLALAVLACLLVSTSAQADPRCFQPVGGVPGAYGQAPNWWSPGATPLGTATSRFFDDPRWQAASSYSHGDDYASFKVLIETVGSSRFLVMAWHIRADPDTSNDQLFFGFWDETSAMGNVFVINKLLVSDTPKPIASYADNAFGGQFAHKSSAASAWAPNNSGGGFVPPLPTWLKNDTRIECTGATCDEWSILVRAPIDPAAAVDVDDPTGVKITVGGVYRFWYQIQNSQSPPPDATAVQYHWPEDTPLASDASSVPPCTSFTQICFPDPMDVAHPWNQIQDGTTCNGDISLARSDIYVNSLGSNQVSLSSPNTFHARPTNHMTTLQSGNAIQATFRIANWGSAVGVSPDWLSVCTDKVGEAIPGGVGSLAQFDVQCVWSVPNPCDFKPAGDPCGPSAGSRTTDQCLLVSLSSAPSSGPYFFSPQSAWHNMLFNGASRIEKTASLDIKALPPIAGGGQNRDLYVYIQTRNMPPKVVSRQAPIDMARLPKGAQAKLGRLELPKIGAIGSAAAKRIVAAVAAGHLTLNEVQAIMPTWVAYVWHDTGKTVGSGPKTVKLLESQPSFGMFAWHDGTLNGWKNSLTGRNITQIGPNYYKISVPEGGAAKLGVRVTACQWPFCVDHYLSSWVLIVISLGLVLLVAGLIYLVARKRM